MKEAASFHGLVIINHVLLKNKVIVTLNGLTIPGKALKRIAASVRMWYDFKVMWVDISFTSYWSFKHKFLFAKLIHIERHTIL